MNVFRLALVLAVTLALPDAGAAAPRPYALDPETSEVGFTYLLLGQPTQGRMPVSRAAIAIDFADVTATRADVALDVTQAQAGLFVATEAMRGPSVLDAERHPEIAFRATRTLATEGGATMEGDLTIRGVTRPVRLRARFLRPPGADPGARDRLAIELTGALSRDAFGASGFPNLVGDRIEIRIRAGLIRRD